jgi:hypothetical protein
MNTENNENKASDQPYYHNLPNILQQTTEESDQDAGEQVIMEADKTAEASPLMRSRHSQQVEALKESPAKQYGFETNMVEHVRIHPRNGKAAATFSPAGEIENIGGPHVSIKNSQNRSFGGRLRKSESNKQLNSSESEIQNMG